ncbi:MAG: hypothetical protein Q7T72_08530 [Bacteroidales bacterium]|nr:hypothetical protein [Bacteroidales bacterium]
MNNYKFEAMKRGTIVLLIMVMFPVIRLTAQNPNLDKLNAYKIGFFTKRLNLTSQEAEKFWPVYNEYQKQKNLIQQEKVTLIRNFNQNENALSDNQLTETGDKLIACIVQESSLAVTFHKKLKEVLPPAKVIRFYQAENQYKVQLLHELQGVKQQQRVIPRHNL